MGVQITFYYLFNLIMITESDIEALFAETVLGIIRNPDHNTNVNRFCSEYHINRNKPTSKVFSMKNQTLFRLMMGIAQLVSFSYGMTRSRATTPRRTP